MARRNVVSGIAVFLALALPACKKAPPPDSLCSYEPVPATADVRSGQGAIEVLGSTDTYFYVLDGAGKQLGSHAVNGALPVKPGDYRVKVNNSVHPVAARSDTLTRCGTGAVLVSGTTDEYYYVLDGAGTQLASSHLGAALSLFPGSYRVRLNNSETAANVAAASTTELKPGTVNVEADTDEYYYVLDGAGKQLASSHVGRAAALFAGTYTLKVNNSQARAEVRAGEALSVPVGTLVARGTTDEYYYVLDGGGTQLASAHLDRALALFPGSYTVKVNNAPVPVRVEAGRPTECPLGTLTVKSAGSEYYYVFDTAGTQLASKQLNQPVSLPAGKYSVKVGKESRAVVVTAGQSASLSW